MRHAKHVSLQTVAKIILKKVCSDTKPHFKTVDSSLNINNKKLVICNYLFILSLGNSNAMEVWYGCKEESH